MMTKTSVNQKTVWTPALNAVAIAAASADPTSDPPSDPPIRVTVKTRIERSGMRTARTTVMIPRQAG